MLQIPLEPNPSQVVKAILADQQVQLFLYQKPEGLFIDINLNGTDISTGILCLNAVMLAVNYSGFLGNLFFIDTQGSNDPTYDGIGTRYFLVYLTSEEYGLI